MTNGPSDFGPPHDDGTAEAHYVHDSVHNFRVIARRNRLLALWAADRMKMTKANAEDYAQELVAGTYARAGEDNILERIAKDFSSADIAWTDAEFRQIVARFTIEAESQLSSR